MQNKVIQILTLVVCSALLFFAVGCSGGEKRPSDFEGMIIDKKEKAILVAEGIRAEDLVGKDANALLKEKHPRAIWVDCEDSGGFTVGQEVAVWIDGPIMESYPEQAKAKLVAVKAEEAKAQ
ncbi:UNVERIFIED_CONTAM: hypothetical protein ABID98_004379 [Brevibacillus sp. OAP136]